MSDYTALEQALGHRFENIELLKQALTHRSLSRDNNERLEFIGDGLLNFVIAKALYDQFPNTREGELSRVRASLVKGETLSQIAKEIDLGRYLILGPGEKKSGGQHRDSILSDSVEAIIAAIYIDSNFEHCQNKILAWFHSRLAAVDPDAMLHKDPKTQLQEALQARQFSLPSYTVTAKKGHAHAQQFEVECQVEGLTHKTLGEGTSRRRAEQQAAAAFLVLLTKS